MPECCLKVPFDENALRPKELDSSYGILDAAVLYSSVQFRDPAIN